MKRFACIVGLVGLVGTILSLIPLAWITVGPHFGLVVIALEVAGASALLLLWSQT